jgi:hypothetical protein
MSFFAFAYKRLFTSAKDIFNAKPNAAQTAERWHLTKDKLGDVYGH